MYSWGDLPTNSFGIENTKLGFSENKKSIRIWKEDIEKCASHYALLGDEWQCYYNDELGINKIDKKKTATKMVIFWSGFALGVVAEWFKVLA